MFKVVVEGEDYWVDIGIVKTMIGPYEYTDETSTECVILKGQEQEVIHSVGKVSGEGTTQTKQAFALALQNGGFTSPHLWNLFWDGYHQRVEELKGTKGTASLD